MNDDCNPPTPQASWAAYEKEHQDDDPSLLSVPDSPLEGSMGRFVWGPCLEDPRKALLHIAQNGERDPEASKILAAEVLHLRRFYTEKKSQLTEAREEISHLRKQLQELQLPPPGYSLGSYRPPRDWKCERCGKTPLWYHGATNKWLCVACARLSSQPIEVGQRWMTAGGVEAEVEGRVQSKEYPFHVRAVETGEKWTVSPEGQFQLGMSDDRDLITLIEDAHDVQEEEARRNASVVAPNIDALTAGLSTESTVFLHGLFPVEEKKLKEWEPKNPIHPLNKLEDNSHTYIASCHRRLGFIEGMQAMRDEIARVADERWHEGYKKGRAPNE